MICVNRETPYPNDKNLERVVIQSDDAPTIFPSTGVGVDDLPDKVEIAPGSVLYVLSTSKSYIFGVDKKWYEWNGNGNAEETGGMRITFHFVDESGNPVAIVSGPDSPVYLAIACTAFIETRDPEDVVVMEEVSWLSEDDPTRFVFETTQLPKTPDSYLIRFSEGTDVVESGTLDGGRTWEPGWYDPMDPTIPDQVAYNGYEIKILNYNIVIKDV